MLRIKEVVEKERLDEGFSLIELLLVITISVILSGIVIIGLSQTQNTRELESARVEIVGILREAQSKATIQELDTVWGVHFENSTTTDPFFALFHTSYGTSTVVRYETLPSSVGYMTSILPEGGVAEVTFSQLSGAAMGSSTVGIYLKNRPASSSTISISSHGTISAD